MKKILILILTLASLSAFSQVPALNDLVRLNPPSSAKSANALDASKSYTATGTDTYAVTVGLGQYTGVLTYAAGDMFTITFTNANTSGTVTINIDGEGAVAIKDNAGNNPGVGDIKAGGTYKIRHNGTNFRIVGASGGGGGSGDVVGPASATDNAITRFDGTTGKLTQNSAGIISDAGLLSGVTYQGNPVTFAYGGTGLSALGTAAQQLRVNGGATALEYYSPLTNPATTTGDLIQWNGSAYSRLAAVATGNVLISGGVGTVSSWGKVGLTTHVSGILPIANMATGTPDGTKFVRDDGTLAVPSVGSLAINLLSAASGANTPIDNTNYLQEWRWNTLAGGSGLKLTSNSTLAASNTQTIFEIEQSGANGTSSQKTFAARFSNIKTGTGAINASIFSNASGGTTNLALQTVGNIFFSTAESNAITSNTKLDVWGPGTATELIARFANSAGTSRLQIAGNGLVTGTGATQNTWAINNTFTSDASNRYNISIGGTYTIATTSGSGFIGRGIYNQQNFTTGNTNQVIVPNSNVGTYTANSTGTRVEGFSHTPTIAGSQPLASHAAFYNNAGYPQWDSSLSPAQITANQDDYNPTGLNGGGAPHGASILRLDTDASRNLTSLVGGVNGRVLIVMNVGAQDLVLKDDDGATGTAANRFQFNADITLQANESIMLVYDGTSSRWRAMAH